MSLVEKAPPPSPVAIVGSRDYPRLDLVRAFVRSLPENACVVSGGARGVDQAAEAEALEGRLLVRSYRPVREGNFWRIELITENGIMRSEKWMRGQFSTFPKAAFTRNKMIVDEAGSVAAFWDGQSKGTLDTIKKAKAAGILYAVYGPEGEEL